MYITKAIDPAKYTLKYTIEFGSTDSGVPIRTRICGANIIPIAVRIQPDTRPNAIFVCTAFVMYNIVMGILQAVGDSRHPLYYLIFSSIVNIILDLLFVGLLGFGVGAAALATIISQFSSAFLCMMRLMRTKDVYQVQISQIRFHKGMLGVR